MGVTALLQLVGETYSEGCLELRRELLQLVGETYSEECLEHRWGLQVIDTYFGRC